MPQSSPKTGKSARPAAKSVKAPAAKKPRAKRPAAPPAVAEGEKRPRGRPTDYTPELAALILQRMADGESLRSICEAPEMPSESTVRAWAVDDRDGFYAHYTRAMKIRAFGWADEIVEISDDGRNDTYIDPESGEERTNHDVISRSKLRVDTRKFMLVKILPKLFGETLDVNHGVQPENPLASLIQRIAGTGLPVIPDDPAQGDDDSKA